MKQPRLTLQVRERFCPEARHWAKRYRTLSDAWEKCPNGYWLAFWLHRFCGVDPDVLMDICERSAGHRYVYTGVVNKSRQLALAFANALREAFTCTGKPRKRKP